MKINESKLRKIIQEEVSRVNEEIDAKSIYLDYKGIGGTDASFREYLNQLKDNKLLPILLQRMEVTKENLPQVISDLIEAGK